MLNGARRVGDFCWINMLTPKPAEAKEFFAQVLGWTYGDIPGLGYNMKVGGKDIGGMFDLAGPNTPPGTPAHIGVMVKVASADAAAARVTSLGGKAMPAFDVAEAGRMAVCFDPAGAAFDVWEPKRMTGTEADSTLHGAPSWFENMTTDVAGGRRFYHELFGWVAEDMPLPTMVYTTFAHGTERIAGMFQITPDMAGVRPFWGTYFTVTDIDATIALVTKLGGSICVPAQDVPGVGRFAGLMSPHGVMFFAITYRR